MRDSLPVIPAAKPGMLSVHCCCNPGLHLGYLPRPRGGALRVWKHEPLAYRAGAAAAVGEPAELAVLRVRMLRMGSPHDRAFEAMDSGHLELDELRAIPGWVDA